MMTKKKRVPRNAVKEAFDNLPSGICYFGENGIPVLCNRQMHRLVFSLTGRDLQQLTDLTDALAYPSVQGVKKDGDSYILPNGSVWRISSTTVSLDKTYTEFVATNVTELYAKKKALQKSTAEHETMVANMRKIVDHVTDINPNNHDIEHHMAQEPTEDKAGWAEYDSCKRVGCTYSTYKEIPATGSAHHWDTEYTSENGQHFYRCTDAGCAQRTGEEKCSGGEATCIELAVCEICKNPYGEVNSNNHDIEHHMAQAPTCGDVGWNEYDTCKREGCDYTTYTEIPATGNHTYKNGVCSNCGAKEPAPYTRVDENGTESAEGKYILFGMYPQTDVTANAATLGLNAGELPRTNNFNGWTVYDYYENGKNSVKYMWYKDVTVGANKYRAVFFSSYRAKFNTDAGMATKSLQDENGYYYNNIFWFKFEPIKWTILEESSQTAFLLCNMVIDSQAYQNTATKSGQYDYYNNNPDTPADIRANNYEYSTIRAWLNDNFYNTAFNDLQKALIMTTLVDNSLDSTGDKTNDNVCNNTNDNVFLISCKDTKTYKDAIGSLTKKSTDYAKAQGCCTDNKDSSSYKGASYWWLRSPNRDSGGSRAQMMREYGAISYDDYNCAGIGVVPALVLAIGG